MQSPIGGRLTAPPDFDSWDDELAEVLECLDDAANYAGWIFDLVEPHLGPEVLEVGAGHGTYTEVLCTKVEKVVATDTSPRCIEVLRERFAAEPRVAIRQGSVDAGAAAGPYDSAVLINVLEHIGDDDEALRNIFKVLKPGGRIVLWVPAFELLYSDFDKRIGHHRRYRKESLRQQLVECSFEVVDLRYVNAVGAIGWLILARMFRVTPTSGMPAKLFDRYFVPVLRRIEARYRPPFGQSLFAVGVRPTPPAVAS